MTRGLQCAENSINESKCARGIVFGKQAYTPAYDQTFPESFQLHLTAWVYYL